MRPSLVPIENEEISKELARVYRKRGINFHTGAKVDKIEKSKSGITVNFSVDGKPQKIETERILIAVGRKPRTENLGLERPKIKVDRGFIKADRWMQSAEPGVSALGHIGPGPRRLAHAGAPPGDGCPWGGRPLGQVGGLTFVMGVEPACLFRLRRTQIGADGRRRARNAKQPRLDATFREHRLDRRGVPLDVRQVGREVRDGQEVGELFQDGLFVRDPIIVDRAQHEEKRQKLHGGKPIPEKAAPFTMQTADALKERAERLDEPFLLDALAQASKGPIRRTRKAKNPAPS